ncbi:MAG: hypothetical protein V4719_01745 [Planctomycetota bacterium]
MYSDDREGTPGGQAKNSRLRIKPDEYYFTDEVAAAFRVSDKTVDLWAEKGLKRTDKGELGMKSYIYFGDWILDWMRTHHE